MKVRKMRKEDLDALSKFTHIGKVLRSINLESYTYKYVAEVKGEIVGFLYAGRTERRHCYSLGS